MVEKIDNVVKKPEVAAKPEQKKQKKVLLVPLFTGMLVLVSVAGGAKLYEKMDEMDKKAQEYVTKEKHDNAFEKLGVGMIKIARETVKKDGEGLLPVVYINKIEQKYPAQDECDSCSTMTLKDTYYSGVGKIEIDAKGKNGDTSFITKAQKMSDNELAEVGCSFKNEGKIIECDSLESIDKICEGEKPTCKGGALANLTGEIKKAIIDVAYRVYISLLGNGSCDKRDVVLKDSGQSSVVIGYDENKIPEAKETDCKVAKGRPSFDVPIDFGSVGTRK
ncbi:MAG: hypothetical protein QW255_02335 [Candidatus Bilamarchaeaceae archaeon]